MIPEQTVVAGDQHFALRTQRLREIFDGTGLLEVRAHHRLLGEALLQFIQRDRADPRADQQGQQ
ncbi:hypothetical protein D3C87_2002520 [compost metagenome]